MSGKTPIGRNTGICVWRYGTYLEILVYQQYQKVDHIHHRSVWDTLKKSHFATIPQMGHLCQFSTLCNVIKDLLMCTICKT